jgi:hypothetical protein
MPNINLTGVETTTNKSTNVNTDQASNTKYPSVKAVFDWAVALFHKKSDTTIDLQSDNKTDYSKGWVYADATYAEIGFGVGAYADFNADSVLLNITKGADRAYFHIKPNANSIFFSSQNRPIDYLTDPTANLNSLSLVHKGYADTKVAQTITNGVTDSAPSQDAVFDALQTITNAMPNDISAWKKTGTTSFKRYYNNAVTGGALTAINYGRNNIQYLPIVISRQCTLAEIGMEITVAGDVGSVVRIAVYRSNNLLPTTLVVDAGTINGNSASVQFITLGTPQLLTPGLYFFAVNHNSTGAITFRSVALASALNVLGYPVTGGTAVGTFYQNTAFTYDVFPATAVEPTAIGVTTPASVLFYLSA